MRNIFLFLWRSYYFILFLLLEVFAFYLIVQNNNFHRTAFVNSSNRLSGSIYGYVNSFTEYIHLKETNTQLAKENAILRGFTVSSFYDNIVLQDSVKDTLFKQQYTYMNAKVVNNSSNKRNNYLTLNRGSLHGVEKEMGVITGNGVVGIVKDVSNHYCSVLSFLHKDTKISAKLASSDYYGSLVWEGGNPRFATLMDIPKHVQLKAGERIVTTSYSAIFPEGIILGHIAGFEVKPGDNFYTIKVLLSANFQNLTHVYVVKNLLKVEQRTLEEGVRDDQ